MTRELNSVEIEQYKAYYSRGCELTEGRLLIQGQDASGQPGWWDWWQLKRAQRYLGAAVAINPGAWNAMWILGKIAQRLGDPEDALEWFLRAHKINPSQPDVAREAGLSALDIGRHQDAIQLCRAAIASSPTDPGLLANLALALCLAGNDVEASQSAAEALKRAPHDQVSATVLEFVRDVAAGVRQRPRKLSDAFPN